MAFLYLGTGIRYTYLHCEQQMLAWRKFVKFDSVSAGVCPPDAITFDYVQQRTDAPFEAVHADAGASYVEEYRFDVSKIEPLVAAPHSPDNRKKAADCSNVAIDRVYIG